MTKEISKPIKVAVGIIIKDGKILCCQRKQNMRYGLQWEFPGGKIKNGENPRECLTRELQEELNISAIEIEPYDKNIQSYPDNGIFEVHYFLIRNFKGELKNKVFESTLWLLPEEFDSVPFLQGNKLILEKLKKDLL